MRWRRSKAGPVTVHGAGRTDAGVHALAQVASVALTASHEAGAIQRGLNAVLPPAVRVVAVEDAPPGFHARFDATGKVYEYRIVNAPFISPFLVRYAWHVPQPLDVDAMREAAGALVGRHDFAAFQGAGSDVRDTIRTIESIEWKGQPGAAGNAAPLTVTLTADGFLRHMVRNIVGTLVEVGVGRWPRRRSLRFWRPAIGREPAGRPPRRGCSWCACATDADLLYNTKLIALRLAGGS